ncbi:MAG: hypothetical protein VW547_17435, partial [Alphaproteobacteria bacterium]
MVDRVCPVRADRGERNASTNPVYFSIGGKRSDNHGHVVFPAAAISDVRKQEGLALGIRDTASELPAHKWMKLGILVYRAIYALQ